MRPILYPTDRKEFETDYLSCLKLPPATIKNINCYLSNVPYKGKPLNFKTLAVMPFKELLKLAPLLHKFQDTLGQSEFEHYNKLFNYKSSSENIRNYLRNQMGKDMVSCYYCNIDYINPFRESEDSTENDRDHFTFDHVLTQNDSPAFALCLYNLVPACYNCNSRFKHMKDLRVNDHVKEVIPSFSGYRLHRDFVFRLLYTRDFQKKNPSDRLKIQFHIKRNTDQIEHYLDIFQIRGRYNFHKGEADKLVRKHENYPPSKIREIAQLTGRSEREIQEDIFGSEFFHENETPRPLVKFKRDIARNIGVEGVI